MELIKSNERLDDLQINNLFIIQDPNGYCFTSDAVALANFVKCKPNSNVIDLCSGSGVIGILVNTKNNLNKVFLVEIQEKLANMSKRSVEYNNLSNKIEVINKPLKNIIDDFKNIRVDCIVCNPPYKKANTSLLLSEKQEIKLAKHEIETNLEEIIKVSANILKFGGKFYVEFKEERLVEAIVLLEKSNLEVKRIKVLPSTFGAKTILIEAIKGGKSGCKVEV